MSDRMQGMPGTLAEGTWDWSDAEDDWVLADDGPDREAELDAWLETQE
jgi:hypothetical protein